MHATTPEPAEPRSTGSRMPYEQYCETMASSTQWGGPHSLELDRVCGLGFSGDTLLASARPYGSATLPSSPIGGPAGSASPAGPAWPARPA